LQWVFARRQTGSVAQPEDVRVDGHGGLTKGHVQHHIGCFAAYAWQSLQGFARAGYLTAMLFNEYLACFQEVAGLVAVKANGL
jgi:hypothetical protein